MGSVYLYDIQCPPSRFEKSQEESIQWLKSAYRRYQKSHTSTEEDYERMLKRVGVSPSQIHRRGHYLADFQSSPEDSEIFRAERSLGISERQNVFQRAAKEILWNLYETRSMPEHLIHVTCTGYLSPSAAQLVAAEKSPQTVVTHSYHMGCYGAFPALRMARGFLAAEAPKTVDIVHTEFCTLHLNPEDPSLEQMVVQTLFADGAAAYRLSGSRPQTGFELMHLGEFLVPESSSAMSWGINEMGFQMSLSKDVPSLISINLDKAFEVWEKQTSTPLRSLLKESILAVHPGGPKIIDLVRQKLDLHESQVAYSRQILRDHGNMSSATVPHIWEAILNDANVPSGRPVLSMAFGPGLTLAMSLMKVIR